MTKEKGVMHPCYLLKEKNRKTFSELFITLKKKLQMPPLHFKISNTISQTSAHEILLTAT